VCGKKHEKRETSVVDNEGRRNVQLLQYGDAGGKNIQDEKDSGFGDVFLAVEGEKGIPSLDHAVDRGKVHMKADQLFRRLGKREL